MLVLILAGVLGVEFWHSTVFVLYGFEVKVTHAFLFPTMLACVVSSFGMFVNALIVAENKFECLKAFLPVLQMNMALHHCYSSGMIVMAIDRLFIIHGIIHGLFCAKVIIASVTREKLQALHVEVIIWILFQAMYKAKVKLDYDLAIWVLLGVMSFRYLKYVFQVIRQIADYLDIWIFFIKPKKSD
mmetsp:Transcript_20323/g.3304  ORF Transcript_20323/g.3304 Transcript_20323/m.3304 type:complete len:186 (+) Transcript_20323:555-1112(+)